MPGLESQSKHQQGPSCLLTLNCTPPPPHTHTPRAPARRWGAPRSAGVREPEAAGDRGETRRKTVPGPEQQGADLLPGARPLARSVSRLPGGWTPRPDPQSGPSSASHCPGRKTPPPSATEKGGALRKAAPTHTPLDALRGHPGTCGLQKITRSRRNLPEDSDRGVCPSTDAQTDGQTDRQRRTAEHRVDGLTEAEDG